MHRCCWILIDRSAAISSAIMVGTARHILQFKISDRRDRYGLAISGCLMNMSTTFRERLKFWLTVGLRLISNNRENGNLSDQFIPLPQLSSNEVCKDNIDLIHQRRAVVSEGLAIIAAIYSGDRKGPVH